MAGHDGGCGIRTSVWEGGMAMNDFAAQWLNQLLEATDEYLQEGTKAALLAACSGTCTAHWAAEARAIREEAGYDADPRMLLAAFCRVLPGGGPEVSVEDTSSGDWAIGWRFAPPACPCPLTEITQNPILCRCGTGHVKGMLEALLGRPLAVTLEGSRLRGDPACSYRIRCADV